MSLEQAAAFGEASRAHSDRGESFAALESLDRGIAIIEGHIASLQQQHQQQRGGFDVELSDLRARLVDFLARKADLLLVAGGTSAALNAALYMCSTDPRSAFGFFIAGQALRKLQRAEQAVDYLTTASKLDPQSAQVRQCLALAVTELRLPSSVAVAGGGDDGATGAAGGGGAIVPTDIDSIVRFAAQYVPTAATVRRHVQQRPGVALGAGVAVLVALAVLLTWEFVMFVACAAFVVMVHRWERKRISDNNNNNNHHGPCCGSLRVPVLEVPLSVLTSAFLSCAAVYLLLM